MKIIKLGTKANDKSTGMRGMVTHMQIYEGGNLYYAFQPSGLDRKTGQPLPSIWVVADRLVDVSANDMVEVELPVKVLGTEVEDLASGFFGSATAVILHISGCIHVEVQPKTKDENGAPVMARDLDIRRLKGPAIKPMTEKALQEDRQKRPSPAPVATCGPRRL